MRVSDPIRATIIPLAPHDLWGVWELVGVRENFSDGQERTSSDMTGYLTYERDVAVVVVGFDHHIHLDAGTFTLSDGIVEHDFDLVLHPEWPRRRFLVRAVIDDGALVLRTSPGTCPDGRTLFVTMTWARPSDSSEQAAPQSRP